MKYSGYWLSIVETNLDNHVLHTFLSCNLSFPSLSLVTSLITPTSDYRVLTDFPLASQHTDFKTMPDVDVPKLSPPQSTLLCTSTTLYSNVVIDIDNYQDTCRLTP